MSGHGIPLGEAVRVWARIALLSFGGPAGQIAVMHRILVEEKKWIGEERFLHALNYCMLLPGPEAQQLATYIGWLLHKTRGGLIAGGLFVLPGFIAIMVLSWLYAAYEDLRPVEALFFGLKAAVLAIVLDAVRRVGSRALKSAPARLLAAAAFTGIFFFALPFPLIVLGAAAFGFFAGRAGMGAFAAGGGHGAGGPAVPDEETALGSELPPHARPRLRWSLGMAGLFLFLWLGPVAALLTILGPDSVYSDIALFFSKMAVVTFGGAYAVLAYVAQQAVETYRWLEPGEMLDGLGMAETTPGPLIMVTQFVGYLAAFRAPDPFSPLVAGMLGAALTTWVTFAPCFLWIFTFAPWMDRLQRAPALKGGLAAVTAAVVGVIANLALWFALHVLFARVDVVEAGPLRLQSPDWTSFDWRAGLISAVAVVLVFALKRGIVTTLAVCAAMGLVLGTLI